MIQISLTAALALYSGILLAGAFAIWLYTEVSAQRTAILLERQHLWRCVFCLYTYLDDEAERMSRCPRCGSFNTLDDDGAKLAPAPAPRTVAPPEAEEEDEEEPRRNPSRQKRKGAKRRGPRKRR